MEPHTDDALNWTVRAFVYDFIADHEYPPTPDEAAAALNMTPDAARAAYVWLHHHHALFLDEADGAIRMAHPFSAVPTDFRVFANGHTYWANCAWDMLGIPAALHTDARIEARFADTQETTRIEVACGAVRGHGEVIYFRQPFTHWYDDLVAT